LRICKIRRERIVFSLPSGLLGFLFASIFLVITTNRLTIYINSYLYYYSVINIDIYYIYLNNNSNIVSLK